MLALHSYQEQPFFSLGQRRGTRDLARFSLDLTWARAEADCAARLEAYPSPPMSGSSPSPINPNPEAGGSGQSGFRPRGSDASRHGTILSAGDYRGPSLQPSAPIPPSGGPRPFSVGGPERMPYPYSRPPEPPSRALSYPAQPHPMMPQSQYPGPPLPGPLPSLTSPFSPAGALQGGENPPYSSPKAQRKTKGHVASACVPCKKAHLRCDAQRPCSRCLSNGKEDSCIDVQHKKRGRPRLREDREVRFDSRPAPLIDSGTSRPVPLYSTPNAEVSPLEDPARKRSLSYRSVESYSSDPMTPRFASQLPPASGSIPPSGEIRTFPPPTSASVPASEPVAFMTTNFEVIKASAAFTDNLGCGPLTGSNLASIVSPGERDHVTVLQKLLQDEQIRKEPNYLPPIYGREEALSVISSLPFSPESIARYHLQHQEVLRFSAVDGRHFPVRIRLGLAKERSIYFVILLLELPHARPFPPAPISSYPRELPSGFPGQGFAQAALPVDPVRYGPRDAPSHEYGYGPRQPVPVGPSLARPGIPPTSSQSLSPNEPSFQVPRSEMPPSRAPGATGYQLPPIRGRPSTDDPFHNPAPRTENRGRRSDIRGLLEHPSPSR